MEMEYNILVKKSTVCSLQVSHTELLQTASQEANSGNKDIVNKVRHIGNKFLNAVEISAQEAVYFVLQMPMRRASRQFQFINTSNPEERTFLLKTIEKIKELSDKSTDIESDNVLKRYQRRPSKLELLCLAHFVAWFNSIQILRKVKLNVLTLLLEIFLIT